MDSFNTVHQKKTIYISSQTINKVLTRQEKNDRFCDTNVTRKNYCTTIKFYVEATFVNSNLFINPFCQVTFASFCVQ